jgi:hypothetical protein
MRNPKTVIVKTAIPTLEQFRIALGLSKKDAKRIEMLSRGGK